MYPVQSIRFLNHRALGNEEVFGVRTGGSEAEGVAGCAEDGFVVEGVSGGGGYYAGEITAGDAAGGGECGDGEGAGTVEEVGGAVGRNRSVHVGMYI